MILGNLSSIFYLLKRDYSCSTCMISTLNLYKMKPKPSPNGPLNLGEVKPDPGDGSTKGPKACPTRNSWNVSTEPMSLLEMGNYKPCDRQ